VYQAKSILPPKEQDITEEDIVSMLEQTIQQKTGGKALKDMNLDELDELEDEEEKILLQMRQQPMAELRFLHGQVQVR